MNDFHTHILPGMDDGAPDIETALAMLDAEEKQGVNTVALTPHFYRNREHISDFLARRNRSWDKLKENLENKKHPQLILAAEVAYVPGMADWAELEQLCYAGTKLLLVEPPMTLWNDEMFRQLYAIEGRRGITPMIAHLDRYIRFQSKARIEQLLETGFPIQVSTAALMQLCGRNRAIRLITEYRAVLVSDCHNMDTRPPNLDEAACVLKKKLGGNAEDALQYADEFFRW